jgi:hypothetical protein
MSIDVLLLKSRAGMAEGIGGDVGCCGCARAGRRIDAVRKDAENWRKYFSSINFTNLYLLALNFWIGE